MTWNIHEARKRKGTYISLKKNYRVGEKVKSKYIYLGAAKGASKILGELHIKPLVDEKETTYSGEMIIGKIAESVRFELVLGKYLKNKQAASVLQNVIILRTLFPESKRKLITKRLEYSILKDSTDLKYLEEVYRFMDRIYVHLGDILYDMIMNAVKKYKLDMQYLAIDGTRIKIYKDKETGMIKFGFSGKERKDLPQANLILGVNGQHIPFFANTYPGNTPDVTMFRDFIHDINTKYRKLTELVKEKFIVFDQGNVNLENIKYVRTLRKDGIHYITLLKTNTAKKFIDKVRGSKMKKIYSRQITPNRKSECYGKFIKGKLYGKECKALVCFNPAIKAKKCRTLERNINAIRQAVESGSNKEDIERTISKFNLKRALKVEKYGGKPRLKIIREKLELKKERYGFFVLGTEHPTITERETVKIYKGKDVVEEGFRVLKSDLEINPVYHSRDDRIETHTVMVVYGYFLLSLLKAVLKSKKIEYSFGELKDTIKTGNAVEGFYEHENLEKRLYVWRPAKLRKELEEVFRALRIKIPLYDVREV